MKINYRPEIDGLRAIAVFSVIFYHADLQLFGKKLFSGGFLGVDIFFVISGYLITSIIFKEIYFTNNFSFTKFYEKRIRRIIPPFIFVILCSLPFAYYALLPRSFIEFSKSIISSVFFISNFYFYNEENNYWKESSKEIPFLHTWSLSIEEQFYIIFPIIIFIIYKFFRKKIIFLLFFGILLSLLFNLFNKSNPILNFYMPHTRAFELLLGSALSYYEFFLLNKKNSLYNYYNTSNLNTIIGIILISYSILFFDNVKYSIFYIFLVLLGTSLIIFSLNKYNIILKNKILVFFGKISYSLYLWHWPVFAFNKITDFTSGSVFKKLIIACIIIFMSIFSYYFIEKPFRSKKTIPYSKLIKILIFFLIFIISVNILIIVNKGIPERLPKILIKDLDINNLKKIESEWNSCLNEYNFIDCSNNSYVEKTVFLIGDSLMDRLAYDLKNKLLINNYKFIKSTEGLCWYLPGFNRININTYEKDEKCDHRYNEKITKKILETNQSIVILGGRLPLYLSNKREYLYNKKFEGHLGIGKTWDKKFVSNIKTNYKIESGIKDSILELAKNNHKVIIVYPIPEVPFNIVKKIYIDNRFKKNFNINDYYTTPFNLYKSRSIKSFELLDSIIHENIHRVYPHKVFCDNYIKNKCLVVNNNNILYVDTAHTSIEGSKMINELIIQKIEYIQKDNSKF